MLTVEATKKWLLDFHAIVQEKKAYLSELDTPIGDGDHGANMARGMSEVVKSFETTQLDTPSEVLKKTAMLLLSKVGGASGPLYGSAFLAMSKVADQATKEELVAAGLAAIQLRGKAEVGEKTMIDVWACVLDDLKNQTASREKVEQCVKRSADLLATKGRASYLGERSIGHIDPGTRSSGYLLEILLEL